MKFISVSAMPFNGVSCGLRDVSGRTTVKLLLVTLMVFTFLFPMGIQAEVIERIVAVIDDEIILLSEFNEAFASARDIGLDFSREEILDEMINRVLLLREARRFRLRTAKGRDREVLQDDELINEYVKRRIRAFIHVSYRRMEEYFKENRESYGNVEFHEVREEIERYLVDREMGKRLGEHIERLRKKAYIRKQLVRADGR